MNFLWNYTKSVVSNRILNRFLHSKEAREIEPADLKQRLINDGFLLPEFKEDFLEDCGMVGNSTMANIFGLSTALQRGDERDSHIVVEAQVCKEDLGCQGRFRNITRQAAPSRKGKLIS